LGCPGLSPFFRPPTYTYDTCSNGLGRVCGVSVAGGTAISYSYDVAGRIVNSVQNTGAVNYPFSYGYNLAGRLATMTLLSGTDGDELL
jgi:YD repeat-containing protein